MFLTLNDLYKLYGNARSQDWCQRTYRLVKLAYDMRLPQQLLTVRQYCDFMKLDINEVYATLGWSGTPPVVQPQSALRRAA